MSLRFLSHSLLVLLLVALTACASYSPRPVTRRAAPPPASPAQSPAQPATSMGDAILTPNESTLRDELPPQDSAPLDDSRYVTPAPVAPANPRSAATILLAEVDAAVAQGDLERAAALCERALRIEPRDAFLWYRLASIRSEQGRVDEANGFARRALSFSTSNTALAQQINDLLRRLE